MNNPRLNTSHIRSFNHLLYHLYEEITDPKPLDSVVDAMSELMPTPWFSVEEFYPATGDFDHRLGRNFDWGDECKQSALKFGHQNPVLAYPVTHGFAPALKISDFSSFREFKHTGYFAEVVGKLPGFRDMLAVYARMPESNLLLSLNHDKFFTDEERFLMEMAQPHIERIFRRSSQYLALPARLTPREREVLHWLAEGKRDEEIASILRGKVRTVKQHVRNILFKLNVETRTGAAAVAWRARMSDQSPLGSAA